jgi:Spy/CpxP family protein refolding chaperone
MRNATTDEERQKVQQKFMEKLTPEQRKQFEERMRAFQNMSPEDRAKLRQQYWGGAGGQQGTQGQ